MLLYKQGVSKLFLILIKPIFIRPLRHHLYTGRQFVTLFFFQQIGAQALRAFQRLLKLPISDFRFVT